MKTYPLLKILADGELHSGQELADRAGVSRTAIWKQLRDLESETGILVERVRGHGYRLSRALDLLDSEHLHDHLPDALHSRLALTLLTVTDSTNSYLAEVDTTGVDYQVCMAEQQTAGRGRRGRHWVSPFADNLALSLAFDLEGGGQAVDGLSLVVGIAVVRALEAVGVSGARLKWPNDVWLEGRKLAGILVELRGEAQGGMKVVVGLGLNVSLSTEQGAGIDQPWITLQDVGVDIDGGRNRLAAELIAQAVTVLDDFRQYGFTHFQAEWAQLDALEGEPVRVVGRDVEGFGAGVDERGCFLVRVGDDIQVLNAGEVSIRRTRS